MILKSSKSEVSFGGLGSFGKENGQQYVESLPFHYLGLRLEPPHLMKLDRTSLSG